jgi:hypothetical protein
MPKKLEKWEKGDPLTALRLNEFTDNINKANDLLFEPPRQADEPSDAEVPADEQETSNDYIESSRIVSQVQVFDQNEVNYALIDRIDKIVFTNGDGDTLTLTFNN